MSSKHWVKRSKLDVGRNVRVWNRGLGVLNGKEIYIALAVTPLVALFGWIQGSQEYLAMGLAGFGAACAYWLYDSKAEGGAYRLSRKSKLDYDSAESGLRAVFAAQGVQFRAKQDKTLKTHTFVFPMYGVNMTLNPYDLIHGIEHGRDAPSTMMISDKLGVLMTLNNISDRNQSFVESLTAAIDEMTLQPVTA